MKNITNDFVSLIDKAISESEHCLGQSTEEWSSDLLKKAISNFVSLKSSALSGKLPPSKGGGLGISRALGEWAPKNLIEAGVAVEEFYREHFV